METKYEFELDGKMVPIHRIDMTEDGYGYVVVMYVNPGNGKVVWSVVRRDRVKEVVSK